MSTRRYFRDGRTSHPRHRDFAEPSSKYISSTTFFTSPKGTGLSFNVVTAVFLVTQTCVVRTTSFIQLLYNSIIRFDI